MKRTLATLVLAAMATPVLANQVTLYEGPNLRGRNVTITQNAPNLGYVGFENAASSMNVLSGTWEFCTEPYFRGDCRTFSEGEYPFLGNKNNRIASGRLVNDGMGDSRPSGSWGNAGDAEVRVYDRENFSTQLRTLRGPTPNFETLGFNDAVASIEVRRGTWEFCTDGYYRGECVTYGPGRYGRLPGKDDKYSSARPVQGGWGGGGHGGWGSSGASWGHGNQGGGGGGSYDRPSYGNNYDGPSRIRLFEHSNFSGNSIWLDRDSRNFDRLGFNDKAQSLIVEGGTWRLCSDGNGEGSCKEFRPGQYPFLGRDLNHKISSAFKVR